DSQRRATADRGRPRNVSGAGRRRGDHVRASAGVAHGSALFFVLMGGIAGMGGSDMAVHTRPTGSAPNQDVIVIARLPAGMSDADLAGRERDTLVLTAEERRWARRRVMTTAGRTLALALPTGSVLQSGAVLYVAADWFVVVECAAEPCF